MRIHTVTYLKIFLLSSLILTSCDTRERMVPEQPGEESRVIRWDIHSSGNKSNGGDEPSTRSLVENDTQLQNLCTPMTDGGQGESIGFYADYIEYNNNGGLTRTKDVFGFRQTRLIYAQKDPLSNWMWNYEGADLLWAIGGKYKVRAFYPQSMKDLIIDESTDADLLSLEYNSHLCQEDLMVAYNEVYTKDPIKGTPSIAITGSGNTQIVSTESGSVQGWQGLSQDFDLDDPIPLYFRHVMAAVKVRFTFDYEDNDELTACSFSNKSRVDGYHTVGVLIYGDADAQASLAANRSFRWITYQSSFDEIPFYTWELTDGKGIPFSYSIDGNVVTENMAVGFSPMDNRYYRRTGSGVVTDEHYIQGTTPLPVLKQNPPYYNENDGWLLVLPQRQNGSVQLEFTTKKYGKMKVDMPRYTGTLEDGTLSNDQDQALYFVPGHRYTYTVTVRRTNLDVSVHVEPWKDLYVTQDIVF